MGLNGLQFVADCNRCTYIDTSNCAMGIGFEETEPSCPGYRYSPCNCCESKPCICDKLNNYYEDDYDF